MAYVVTGSNGVPLAHAHTRAAAHRVTRRANMAGSRVRVELHEVWVGSQLLYSGVNQSEARRTFVRAAIPNRHQFARALGLGQQVSYPPGLELRDVNSRGKTLSSLKADTIEPTRMMRLHAQWDYSDYQNRAVGQMNRAGGSRRSRTPVEDEYDGMLKKANKMGAAHATGLPLLAQTTSVVAWSHPGLNPAFVYAGAKRRGLDHLALSGLSGLQLNDLMFEGMGI